MKTLLSAVVAATLALMSVQAGADEGPRERQVSLVIESKTLAEALDQWAQQTGFQIFVPNWDLAKKISAPRLEGKYGARDALNRLLEGTPLMGVWTTDKAVTIREKPTPIVWQTGAGQASGPQRLVSDALGTGSTTTPPNVTYGGQASPPARTSGAENSEAVEEIVVTGTHIAGAANVGTQPIIITRKDIQASGVSSTASLFEALPQNVSAFSFDGAVAPNGSALQGGNLEGATAVDLRGLGPQSTLVLVNGQRRAGAVQGRVIDVSTIPLALIERVDVIAGGHAAVYGSDAVAGVVNIILRRDFDGAQTQLTYGDSQHPGGDQFNFSQVVGRNLSQGNFVAAYDYVEDRALDLLDTGLVVSPSSFGIIPERFDIAPARQGHSLMLAGAFRPSDAVELYGDAHYTDDTLTAVRNYSIGGFFDIDTHNKNSRRHFNASAGVRVDVAADWKLDISGNQSSSRNNRQNSDVFAGFGQPISYRDEAKLTSLSAVASGPGPVIGSVQSLVAVGAEGRVESLQLAIDDRSQQDDDRTIRSAFLEVLMPLVASNSARGMKRLDLSLAARLDDYSDAGSSFNPQVGLTWEPITGLAVQAAYSTAFRAPSLIDLGGTSFSFLTNLIDPTSGVPEAPALILAGSNASLDPEEATTWNVGLDIAPAAMPWLRIAATYFNVEYERRIDVAAFSGADEASVLLQAPLYGDLLDTSPEPGRLDELAARGVGLVGNQTGVPFDPSTQSLADVFPDIVVFDNRVNNIAVESVSGMDLRVDTRVSLGRGSLVFGVNGTYTIDHRRAITATSPAHDAINEVGKPPDFRFRANTGWTDESYSVFLAVNYTDDYPNSFAVPGARVDSWTTVDLAASYTRPQGQNILDGLSFALNVANLLDADPPEFLDDGFGVRFDAANSNGLGRYVSVQIGKRW
jgi:iron complex outermembrane recepter protein